jgi:Protein of unknown function (DUF2752)
VTTSPSESIATNPSELAAMPPRSVCAGALGLTAAAATILYTFDPSKAGFYPTCPFFALTGLYCPGCGACRAVHALLHGHLTEAFGLNPLMLLSVPFLAYLFLPWVVFAVAGKRIPAVSVPALWGWLALWTILAYWVLRNVPYYPLDLLAP